MAGKHGKKSSKAPLIILIIVAAAVIAAIVICVILFTNNGTATLNNDASKPETTASQALETEPSSTIIADESTEANQEAETATEKETGVSHRDEPVDVVVPTDSEGEISYFNASFVPNGTVEDTYTGAGATLREVFGSGYADGVITFNTNGTFTDTLSSSSVDSGSYVVQNGKIIATYTNDKNMDIVVTDWNGSVPSAFYINYGGYNVYFG